MKVILLCLVTLFTTCTAKEEGKIIGGTPLSISEASYQISFRYMNSHFCGGTIYNPNFIVTAAHCVAEFDDVAFLTIVAGQTKLSENSGQIIAIKKMTPHPKYNPDSIDYDVAILELAQPLNFNENVLSLEPSSTPAKRGSIAFVTGWGTTTRGGGGDVSDQLLGVEVKIQSYLFCQLQYSLKLTPRMFCAGNLFGGSDSCQGDSGGPVKYGDKLIGVVSFGRGCGNVLAPGVYTDVSTVLDFIKEITKTQ